MEAAKVRTLRVVLARFMIFNFSLNRLEAVDFNIKLVQISIPIERHIETLLNASKLTSTSRIVGQCNSRFLVLRIVLDVFLTSALASQKKFQWQPQKIQPDS